MNERTPTDAERVDLTRARRWYCGRGGTFTVVAATSEVEAQAIAAYWIARRRGGQYAPIDVRHVSVREASDEDVERWLALRAQDAAGRAGAAKAAGE